MKAIRFLFHPFLLIASFLFLLISGEHWGGFYVLYILLALPHGGIHALLGIAGVLLVLLHPVKQNPGSIHIIPALLKISGAVCMILSLYLFFYNDPSGYNQGSFEQTMPLFTISLFGALATGSIIYQLTTLIRKKSSAISDPT